MKQNRESRNKPIHKPSTNPLIAAPRIYKEKNHFSINGYCKTG
jgi:hypothetical protein